MSNPTYTIGLDLGQRNDFTAVSVIERTEEMRVLPHVETPQKVGTCAVKQLDRIRQESYEAVADAMVTLSKVPLLTRAPLVIDQTGVGAAVGDMLQARGLRPYRITIHGGTAVLRDGRSISVPKRDLATTVAILLESKRLQIAGELPLARVLTDELANFKVKVSSSGHDSYGAGDDWRDGNHDDLVLSVALACWFAETRPRGGGVF